MPFRIRMHFATAVSLFTLLAGCGTRAGVQDDDKKAAVNVALAFERAVQSYDFDKADSLITADARWIEESYPHPVEPDLRQAFQPFRDTGIRLEYGPRDAVADVKGNVAVVTLTLHSTWTANTAAGRATLGGSTWRAIFAESMILVKNPGGWRIAFGHTTQIPPDVGVTPDSHWDRGGMKLAEVRKGGPADRAGLKPRDVMIDYGGQKIDRLDDFYRLRYAQHEGDKVLDYSHAEERETHQRTHNWRDSVTYRACSGRFRRLRQPDREHERRYSPDAYGHQPGFRFYVLRNTTAQ